MTTQAPLLRQNTDAFGVEIMILDNLILDMSNCLCLVRFCPNMDREVLCILTLDKVIYYKIRWIIISITLKNLKANI